MRDMPTQKYMFPVDHEKSSRPADRPSARPGRDPDHEARKLLAGEIEAAIMFSQIKGCDNLKMTAEDRGVLAQAIRAQAARKRPQAERRGSLAFRLLAAQIELLISVYECDKLDNMTADFGPPSDRPETVDRLIVKINSTIKYIQRQEDVTK